jgi:hypothetical protein
MAGQTKHEVRRYRQHLYDGPVQGNPDGELDKHRHHTAHWAYACLLVKPHLPLGHCLPILAVLFLQLPQFGLKCAHGLGGL